MHTFHSARPPSPLEEAELSEEPLAREWLHVDDHKTKGSLFWGIGLSSQFLGQITQNTYLARDLSFQLKVPSQIQPY